MLEEVMAGIVAAAPITEQQDFVSVRIVKAAISKPPAPNTGTGKFGRIMTGAKREVADIARDIIEAMRHHDAVSRRAEIMVTDMDALLGIELTLPKKSADQLFFLHPYSSPDCPVLVPFRLIARSF